MTTEKNPSRADLQRFYVDSLSRAGYKPDLDPDGDVRFKHEGFSYFIQVMENQVDFFRIVLPNFWEIESPEERAEVTRNANALNAERSLAKVFIVRDDTWCTVELFLPSRERFAEIFPRAIVALDAARAAFSARMRNQPALDYFDLTPERGTLAPNLGQMRSSLLETLGREGFRPKELGGGVLGFTTAARTAQLELFASDSDSVLLVISKFRPIGDAADRLRVAQLCQSATADIKAAIAYPEGDDTTCIATVLAPTGETIYRTFNAMVSAVRSIPAPDLKKSWWKRLMAN